VEMNAKIDIDLLTIYIV